MRYREEAKQQSFAKLNSILVFFFAQLRCFASSR